MNQGCLVSIIVPVFNVEDYLKECINSIIDQDYANIEVLLIDDGSTDNSGKLCDEFAQMYSVVTAYHKQNGGLSSARNYGIRNANGEYYCFIDSDDYVSKDFISTMLQNLVNSKMKMTSVGYLRFYENGTNESMVLPNINQCFYEIDAQIHLNQYGYYGASAWNKMFHKSLFEDVSFPEGKLSEDWYIMYRVIEKAGGIYFNSAVKYFYRQRQGSITKSTKINTDAVAAAKEVLDYYVKKKWNEAIPYAVQSYIMANIGVYNAYLIRSNQNVELMKYRENVIRVLQNFKMNQDGMSKTRKLQFFLFCHMPLLYDMMFKIFNKNRTKFIKNKEKI